MGGIDLSDLVPEYLSEAREHLATLEQGLLSLESSADDEARLRSVNTLFRSAHTIKGSSRVMGYTHVTEVAHALEDILEALRERQLRINRELVDGLLRAVDFLCRLIALPPDTFAGVDEIVQELRTLLISDPDHTPPLREAAEPAPAASKPAQPETGASAGQAKAEPEPSSFKDETVRVAVARLDELLRLTGELMMGVQHAQERDKKTLELVLAAERQLRTAGSNLPPAGGSELFERLEAWRNEHADGSSFLVAISERLEQEVMALRLYPISSVLAGLPRLVRDLAKEHDKLVQLEVRDENTELDRRILQGIGEPLLHLVRNAVDHGLEPADHRVVMGKPATGKITVHAFRQGGQVRIEIGDDGRGLSPATLREVAVRKKLLGPEEAANLDDTSALELIYLPGFSTSALITATSGRGVGMDVVKESLAKLGGSVELWTRAGAGTRFTLVLPLTLTLARVLLVGIGDHIYAIPTGNIERLVRLSPHVVQTGGGREQLILDGEPVPLFRSNRLLSGTAPESNTCPAVVFSIAGQRVAFTIGSVLDEREVVLKPLGEVLGRADLASGATLLQNGAVALVLDPAAMLRQARGGVRRAAKPTSESRTRRILVVDDSSPTRELERSILIASGYAVETAVDGADGWRKVQAGVFDLVITDIEMPGMSGFELTQKIRGDERYAGLPVVIITGLDKERDKRRGLEVGAQAYLVKNSFDQTALLQTLVRLLP